MLLQSRKLMAFALQAMSVVFFFCLVGCSSGQIETVPSSTEIWTPEKTEVGPPGAGLDVQDPASPAPADTLVNLVQDTPTPVVRLETSTPSSLAFTWTPQTTFTATPIPTNTLTPTEGPTPRFTRTPTNTPTSTQTPAPRDAALRISRPGLYSKITSPYKIEAMITRGEDGYVYLTLTGEDQQIIHSQALDYRRSVYSRFLIVPQIEFALSGVAETARLTLETRDLLGRVMALSSVDIVLLSIGDNETNPPQRLYEPYLIEFPDSGAVVQGGRLVVGGQAARLSANPLLVELVGENGEILASRALDLGVPAQGQTHAPFVVELLYTVEAETNARLTIRQESDNRLPGTVALSSVALQLFP